MDPATRGAVDVRACASPRPCPRFRVSRARRPFAASSQRDDDTSFAAAGIAAQDLRIIDTSTPWPRVHFLDGCLYV
jgi:hypothetical protein